MENSNTAHSFDKFSRILAVSAVVLLFLTNIINISGLGLKKSGDEPHESTQAGLTEPPLSPTDVTILPSSVTLSAPSEYLTTGSTMQVGAEVFPAEAEYSELIWSCGDEAIATVDSTGLVTAVSRGETCISVRTDTGSSAFIPISVIEPSVIYLCPSFETDNVYPVGSTNESEQCRRIAEQCRDRLTQAGITVVICEDGELTLKGRARAAKEAGADYYVAIQSGSSKAEGLRIAFHRRSSDSVRMSYKLNDVLSARMNSGSRGELFSALNNNIKEVEYVEERGIPAVYIEVQNHNSPENAQWIIDNTQQIGYGIADGILYFLLTK